ncbi:hypothetical protein NQ317_013409 [Molorchus minor]|uniref:Uncharacterized protein n=1 Tax=Molorchus minor TaxID=1323400 RepID=A0ABQ9JD89_9CUCU|nr:hypothetical protein NQ317_013409 [Molorchus minor]
MEFLEKIYSFVPKRISALEVNKIIRQTDKDQNEIGKVSAMPRCLMAKKFKAYTWPERSDPHEDEEEEIDVVGDSPTSCWGPSSPTEGATAP